jgi:hypothetical protein
MIMRTELPRNTGSDGDGVAQSDVDHFEKCSVCSQWFDMRDLAQVAEHIHDASEVEVAEWPSPEYERRPPTEAA